MVSQVLVFDVLKRLRRFSANRNMAGVLEAVENAEHHALSEICNVNLDEGDDNYDAVMAVVFPQLEKQSHR